MRSLKTAVKIWKKEIEFKLITWGIEEKKRTNFRTSRQAQIKDAKRIMATDLLNRNRIGDIILCKDDLEALQRPQGLPVFKIVEEIYRKYL
jgi:hypothetical protein